MQSDVSLKAVGISHAYGKGNARVNVLNDFSLTLASGAFEALMGPSGSGKSTFLHLASGLLVPSAGSLEIGGTEITKLSDAAVTRFRRRHIGVVFQSFNLIDTLTVAENIVLPVKLDHAKPDKARLDSLLERLGLTERANHHPQELSGGERQRVAVARALFAKPNVILADEPTGNLDVAASQSLCTLLRQLNEEEKCAILLVTHDPMVAASAQKVHFLKNGRIVASCDTQHNPEVVSRKYLETYQC